jgi:hypothetical protein
MQPPRPATAKHLVYAVHVHSTWHNQLKSHFLHGQNRGRGGRLIYVLSHDVDLFFQAEGMRSQVRFGRHSKGETFVKKQLKFLASKSQEDLQAMVIFLDGKCVVRPFSVESVLYNIIINNNAIEGCNCDYSVKTRRACKHMMVLFQAYGSEKILTIPSLQALKSQWNPRAIAQTPLHTLSPDPFEEMVELTHDDDTFVEVQEIKEIFRKVVYMEHRTPQQV